MLGASDAKYDRASTIAIEFYRKYTIRDKQGTVSIVGCRVEAYDGMWDGRGVRDAALFVRRTAELK